MTIITEQDTLDHARSKPQYTSADSGCELPKSGVALAIIVVALCGTFARIPFVLTTCGEDDAVGLLTTAFSINSGLGAGGAYTVRTSPAYLMMIIAMLKAGVPLSQVPAWLSALNMVSGCLASICAGLVAARMIGWRAVSGVALLQVCPAVWVGSLYGMPHVPSLAAFVAAIYIACLQPRRPLLVIAQGLGIVALIVIGVTFKADIVLIFPGALMLVWLASGRRWQTVAVLCLGMGIALIATVMCSGVLSPGVTKSSGEFASRWTSTWPAHWREFFDGRNLGAMAFAMGPVIWLLVLAGVVLIIRQCSRNGQLLLVALGIWVVVPVLFWGIRPGNSVRHLLAGTFPLPFVAGYPLTLLKSKVQRVMAMALCFILQFSTPWLPTWPSPSTTIPSTKLCQFSRNLREEWKRKHEKAADALRNETSPVLFCGGNDSLLGLYEAMVIASEISQQRFPDFPFTVWEIRTRNDRKILISVTHRRPEQLPDIPKTWRIVEI